MLSQDFMYDQPLTAAYIENVKGGVKYTQLYKPPPYLLFSILVPTNSRKESLRKYLRQM